MGAVEVHICTDRGAIAAVSNLYFRGKTRDTLLQQWDTIERKTPEYWGKVMCWEIILKDNIWGELILGFQHIPLRSGHGRK